MRFNSIRCCLLALLTVSVLLTGCETVTDPPLGDTHFGGCLLGECPAATPTCLQILAFSPDAGTFGTCGISCTSDGECESLVAGVDELARPRTRCLGVLADGTLSPGATSFFCLEVEEAPPFGCATQSLAREVMYGGDTVAICVPQ